MRLELPNYSWLRMALYTINILMSGFTPGRITGFHLVAATTKVVSPCVIDPSSTSYYDDGEDHENHYQQFFSV